MNYCLIKNNQIIDGPRTLPKNNENVSNFNILKDEELKLYGWLPYYLVDNKLNNQILVETTIEILENQVIETKIYRDMTQDELKEKEDKLISDKWNSIRNKRNRLLIKCDWTQLLDSSVDKTSWANYRQELRDIPQTYTDPDDVIWPIAPTN